MPNVLKRLIARLLHLANQGPPFSRRSEFYALKERILARFGTRAGDDVQHIRKECWGYEEDGYCLGRHCNRCGGTGIWDERWILLERWELCGYVFHRPAGSTLRRDVTIEGRITHGKRNRQASLAAALWLALIFDRQLFWQIFRASRGYPVRGQRWPMILRLQAVVFILRMFLRAFYLRRCESCWRPVFRYSPKSYLFRIRCSRCERLSRIAFDRLVGAFAEGDDDLPF